MPVISGATAPTFSLPYLTVRGLAAPSRGARETCAFRLTMEPGAPPVPHMVDREEVFVLLSGQADATLGDISHPMVAGDALVVPANTTFSLANPYAGPAEIVAVLPAGGRAIMPGEEPVVPPWAR